jgi:ATP-binding cassette subfamily F protein 3
MSMQAKPPSGKLKSDKIPVEATKPAGIHVPVNKDAKKQLQKQEKLVVQLEEDMKRLQEDCNRLELQLSAPEIYSDRQKFLVAESEYNKAALNLTIVRQNYDVALEKLMELEEDQ